MVESVSWDTSMSLFIVQRQSRIDDIGVGVSNVECLWARSSLPKIRADFRCCPIPTTFSYSRRPYEVRKSTISQKMAASASGSVFQQIINFVILISGFLCDGWIFPICRYSSKTLLGIQQERQARSQCFEKGHRELNVRKDQARVT